MTTNPTSPQAVDLNPSPTAAPTNPNEVAQDPATVAIRVSPPTPPIPNNPDAPLVSAEQIRLTLDALQKALDALPLDEDLPTPKAVEANFVRRSLLNASISRLRVDYRRFQELVPTATMLRDWCDTLTACHEDLSQRREEAVTLAKGGVVGGSPLRAEQSVNNLRYSLHDLAHGPDLVGSGEFMFEDLATWFTAHNISPLPGERGFFAGRGGLHSAKARLKDTQRELAIARADLENSLAAAQQLLEVQQGRGVGPAFSPDLHDVPDEESGVV
jgi:hypothetical protein